MFYVRDWHVHLIGRYRIPVGLLLGTYAALVVLGLLAGGIASAVTGFGFWIILASSIVLLGTLALVVLILVVWGLVELVKGWLRVFRGGN
jgi:hypothetical protein